MRHVINIKVNTKYKSRAEIQNIKKEKTETNIIKNPTNETGRNTRKEKQWRYRPTRKQKIKWQYSVLIHQ